MSVAIHAMEKEIGPAGFDSGTNFLLEDGGALEGSDQDLDKKEGIRKPGPHDVLLGRGGGTNNHVGNVQFRQLVNKHKMRYLACSKVDKPKVAREVVILWRKLDPPGRFLQRLDETKRGPGSVKDENNIWVEVGDKKAREKASQCLRERTPDVLPYLSQLRQHQDQMTEQGVSMVEQQMKLGTASANPLDAPIMREFQARQFHAGNNLPPDHTASVNVNSARRGSLPATAFSTTNSAFPNNNNNNNNNTASNNTRLQDRRTSAPTIGRLQGQQPASFDMQRLMARQQQVLREAYTAIERTPDVEPFPVAGMQHNEQIMPPPNGGGGYDNHNHQLAQMQEAQMLRNRMMAQQQQGQAQAHQMMSANLDPGQMNSEAQRLAQQQQYLLQEQQRLAAEQQYIARQERILSQRQAEVRRHQAMSMNNVNPNQVPQAQGLIVPGHNASTDALSRFPMPFNPNSHQGGDVDLEPLPYEGNGSSLMSVPDMPKSSERRNDSQSNNKSSNNVQQQKTLSSGTRPSSGGINGGQAPQCWERKRGKKFSLQARLKSSGDPESSRDDTEQRGSLLESTTKDHASGAAGTGAKSGANSDLTLKEYKKTLENYIHNHQATAPAGDIDDDDASETGGLKVEGIDTSEWIRQALNDSSGGELSPAKGKRSLHSTHSKKSLMSMATSSEQMSLAFSDMDESFGFSKGSQRKTYGRSMSIASAHSLMSELTDFDELDCL